MFGRKKSVVKDKKKSPIKKAKKAVTGRHKTIADQLAEATGQKKKKGK